MTDEILKVVSEYLDVPVSELTPEKTFDDLGVDSLDFAEILFEVEEQIGIKAKGDLMELRSKIHCLGDVIEMANELVREEQAKKATNKA
jgi:acyl carrier protein